MPKVDKNAPEILIVFFHPVIEGLDVLLVEKAQHFFLQLSAAFAGDDLYQADALIKRLLDDAVQLGLDLIAPVVDFVQVQF